MTVKSMSQASVSVKMQHLLAKILENVDLKKLLAPSTIAVVCICIMEPPHPTPKSLPSTGIITSHMLLFLFFFFFLDGRFCCWCFSPN